MTTRLLLSLTVLAAFIAAPGMAADQPTICNFSSGNADCDAAYQLARKVLVADVKDGNFLAGTFWSQVWTRDTSYSVDLACALLHPDISRKTLLGLKQDVEGIGECWYQDKCGHFAGWPNLTDAIVGATGMWALYQTTGDKDLLRPLYSRTLNSLKRAERDAFNAQIGLFGGCSTFMESNSGWPKAYANNGPKLAKSYTLSTNLLYYNGYLIAAKSGALLGEDVSALNEKASKLKAAINQKLWLPAKGHYAYFVGDAGEIDDHMEGCGLAFAILFDVAGPEQAAQILKNTYVTQWGIPCLWPQYAEWKDYKRDFAHYYHNGMIWPFVQGYWAWGAAKMKDQGVFGRELDGLVRLSKVTDTFMEFYFPEDAKPGGSHNQLWSASGFLGMIYHGLCGMNFEENGIRFAPVVPASFKNVKLTQIKYRGAVINLSITGNGTHIKQFSVDGKPQTNACFDATMTGAHDVEIQME